MEASVSEIHDYPLRPDGFEEPLFPSATSKRVVAEHLLRAPWLSRASEVEGRGGQAAHCRRESVEIEKYSCRVRISWALGKRRCRKERWVVEVLDRWREIREWWDEDAGVDRTVVRVLLSDGAVVDLAREGSVWFLVGVAD
ncbi:MAG: hypothetical protein M3272_04830 [Actinomycetota bacterium]|nr:hypothetical protein [Actinomycetota bacterium]